MTGYAIVMCVFGVICLIGVVCALCDRDRKLPPPRPDERDWTGTFMRDVKRHGR